MSYHSHRKPSLLLLLFVEIIKNSISLRIQLYLEDRIIFYYIDIFYCLYLYNPLNININCSCPCLRVGRQSFHHSRVYTG